MTVLTATQVPNTCGDVHTQLGQPDQKSAAIEAELSWLDVNLVVAIACNHCEQVA